MPDQKSSLSDFYEKRPFNPKSVGPPVTLRKGHNPYIHFSDLEQQLQKPGPHPPELRQEYADMIEVFQQKTGDEIVANNLAAAATGYSSEGAARGLQGTTVEQARQLIREAIEEILAKDAKRLLTEPAPRVVGYVAPLALAGTNNPDEVQLLLKAIRFQRGNRAFNEHDQKFRDFAVEALVASESKSAVPALLCLITDVAHEATRRAIRDAVLKNDTSGLKEQCRWLVSLPRKDAVYYIAHELQNKSPLRAMLASSLGRWRYRGVFADLSRIANSDST